MLNGVCSEVKSVRKPDAVAQRVRFDERGCEKGLCATASTLDSTGLFDGIIEVAELVSTKTLSQSAEINYPSPDNKNGARNDWSSVMLGASHCWSA